MTILFGSMQKLKQIWDGENLWAWLNFEITYYHIILVKCFQQKLAQNWNIYSSIWLKFGGNYGWLIACKYVCMDGFRKKMVASEKLVQVSDVNFWHDCHCITKLQNSVFCCISVKRWAVLTFNVDARVLKVTCLITAESRVVS